MSRGKPGSTSPTSTAARGWICCADPETPACPRPRRRPLPPRRSPRPRPDAVRPLTAAGRTRLYLAIGAVAVVALGSAVLLVVLARRKQ